MRISPTQKPAANNTKGTTTDCLHSPAMTKGAPRRTKPSRVRSGALKQKRDFTGSSEAGSASASLQASSRGVEDKRHLKARWALHEQRPSRAKGAPLYMPQPSDRTQPSRLQPLSLGVPVSDIERSSSQSHLRCVPEVGPMRYTEQDGFSTTVALSRTRKVLAAVNSLPVREDPREVSFVESPSVTPRSATASLDTPGKIQRSSPSVMCDTASLTHATGALPGAVIRGFQQSNAVSCTDVSTQQGGPAKSSLSTCATPCHGVPPKMCILTRSDLETCSRLTQICEEDAELILTEYRSLVGLLAKSVRPGDEEFADDVAFRHIFLITDGPCLTLLSQVLSERSETCAWDWTPTPPKTWQQLKDALLDALLPPNPLRHAAMRLLGLRQGPSECLLAYEMRFHYAMDSFKLAVERAGMGHSPQIVLHTALFEAGLRPDLKSWMHLEDLPLSLRKAFNRASRFEGAPPLQAALVAARNSHVDAMSVKKRDRGRKSRRAKRSKRDRWHPRNEE